MASSTLYALNLVKDGDWPDWYPLLTRAHDASHNADHREQRVFREITRNISAKIGSETAIKAIDKIEHPHSATQFSQRTKIRIQWEYSRGICDDKRLSRPRSSDCFRYANTVLLILVLGQHLRRLRIHRQRVLIDTHGGSLVHSHVGKNNEEYLPKLTKCGRASDSKIHSAGELCYF